MRQSLTEAGARLIGGLQMVSADETRQPLPMPCQVSMTCPWHLDV
ncbi:hypothetical protein [Ktedonobacter racemifer]|nr:hypothetical protein [Ktedonobacter racemifer]